MLDILSAEYQLGGQREGIHVSDVNHCLSKSFWARKDPAPPSEDEIGFWSIGWALERVMIERLHVEPFEVDGITMSIDFKLPDGTIADLKTTRMAPQGRKGEGGFQMPESWLKQFAAYRYGWNERALRVTRNSDDYGFDFGVVVVHLIQPEIQCWRVSWTQNELNQAWEETLDRANVLESMLASDNPMPYEWRLGEWECKGCSRSLACGLAKSVEGISK